jgi:ankyrin repeat protein
MAAADAVAAIIEASTEGDLEEYPPMQCSAAEAVTILCVTAAHGEVDSLRVLLKRGVPVNAAGGDGQTALHFAAMKGHEEMVSFLLSSGADAHLRSEVGMTALMEASQNGYAGVVRLLLRHTGGRGVNETNIYGYTALWWACCEGYVEVARALLLAGADHTIPGNDDRTPRQAAVKYGHKTCVQVIEVSEGSCKHRSKGPGI